VTPKPGDMIRVCLDGTKLEGGIVIRASLSCPVRVIEIGPDGLLTGPYGWVTKYVSHSGEIFVSEGDCEW